MRFSESPHRSDGASTAVTRLPCPQAPLQSMTAAASLTTPVFVPQRGDPHGPLRRQASNRHLRLTHPPPQAKVDVPTARVGWPAQRIACTTPRSPKRSTKPAERWRRSRTDPKIRDGPPERKLTAETAAFVSGLVGWAMASHRLVQQSPRWRAHRRPHAGFAAVVRTTRSALRPALRRRQVVAARSRGIASPGANAALALQLPSRNDRFRSPAHGKP